ncbi:hypothetical protein TEA_005079 [Camellia sinensis var. sinensis]|uniref:Uncharacterized protein n=1 Tax=Camellia sinensis var. sinensis TaxID=542762 RepID=A0A4S4DYK9_CAMSN|nr:hypothetical protein TEA_005079 [Camellia sinensis var. sinensis]
MRWLLVSELSSMLILRLVAEKIEDEPRKLEMAAKPLTSETIALTEKKMDMTLDDIIKMSKSNTTKANKPRVSNRNQKFVNSAAQEKSTKVRRFMDSRSSLRQGVLAQRRSNFQGNQFPLATEAARKAAVAPFRNRAFNRSRGFNHCCGYFAGKLWLYSIVDDFAMCFWMMMFSIVVDILQEVVQDWISCMLDCWAESNLMVFGSYVVPLRPILQGRGANCSEEGNKGELYCEATTTATQLHCRLHHPLLWLPFPTSPNLFPHPATPSTFTPLCKTLVQGGGEGAGDGGLLWNWRGVCGGGWSLPVEERVSCGGRCLGQPQPQPQVNTVPKQKPQTLDSLFANMKEQRIRALSQQSSGRRNGGGQPRHQHWGRGRFGN